MPTLHDFIPALIATPYDKALFGGIADALQESGDPLHAVFTHLHRKGNHLYHDVRDGDEPLQISGIDGNKKTPYTWTGDYLNGTVAIELAPLERKTDHIARIVVRHPDLGQAQLATRLTKDESHAVADHLASTSPRDHKPFQRDLRRAQGTWDALYGEGYAKELEKGYEGGKE